MAVEIAPTSATLSKPCQDIKATTLKIPGQFLVVENANEAFQFVWANPGVKSTLEIQLLPITLMLICQIIFKIFSDDIVFGIAVGCGIYLPPIHLFSYIVGTFTNYRTSYCVISVCLPVMALAVYVPISIMVYDIAFLLQNLIFLQDKVHPIAIWTPWTIIFFCNVTLIMFSAIFTVMCLADLYRYKPLSSPNHGSSVPVSNSRGVIVLIP